MSLLWNQLVRRKHIVDDDDECRSGDVLRRCLSTLDLVALAVGSTLGAGAYVLAGQVASEQAGPGVVLSFGIAAFASLLAGLCYAEFAARVPRAGSAYVYSYVAVGELVAFIIGWNLILEYVIGTASVARAWSAYADALLDERLAALFQHYLALPPSIGLAAYVDMLALGITLALTALLAKGVRESALLNNALTAVNLAVILFVVVVGATQADFRNWQLSPPGASFGLAVNLSASSNASSCMNFTTIMSGGSAAANQQYGSGGFLPFGLSGVLAGAATCFYGFVGFDCVATTAEEVRRPQRAIPIGIALGLVVISACYLALSAVLTLMTPYYLLDGAAPLPQAFARVGLGWASSIISVGALAALTSSLLGCLFPMPRVVYAMADDGLLFRFLARIDERTRTPLIATCLSGSMAGVFAAILSLGELIDMMSIGTLLAYSLVAACSLVLRYRPLVVDPFDEPSIAADESTPLVTKRRSDRASKRTWSIVNALIALHFLLSFLIAIALDSGATLLLSAVLLVLLIGGVLTIAWQPQNVERLDFRAPFLPLLPLLSISINAYLMVQLPRATWMRFVVWLAAGALVYFGYGIRHSRASMRRPRSVVGRSK